MNNMSRCCPSKTIFVAFYIILNFFLAYINYIILF